MMIDDEAAKTAAPSPTSSEIPAETPAQESEGNTEAAPEVAAPMAKASEPKKPREAAAKKIVLDVPQARPKADCIELYRKHPKDVGSTDVQIALLTDRILHLTEHLKVHPKDKHTNYGLRKLVSQRKSLLSYLERKNVESFIKLKASLNLR